MVMEPEKTFCPLLKEPCRKDCAWCVEMDVFTEDWAAKQWYCSVNMIASHLEEAWVEWVVKK